MNIAEQLEGKYGFSKVEAAKCEMLLLWFKSVSPNLESIPEEDTDNYIGFYHRFKWLLKERPYFYSWGPFYRDHGYVGLRKEGRSLLA